MDKISLKGLKETFLRFEREEKSVDGKHWRISMGADSEYWQLSYDYVPVLDSIRHKLMNICLGKEDFMRVCGVIIDAASA